jgi:hypothetical protein
MTHWLVSPSCATAATVSPPPTTLIAPALVAAAIADAMANIPAPSGDTSQTLIGPFQNHGQE